MVRSKKMLESFTVYCNTHPYERFWQALRNWSNYAFIWGETSDRKMEDTFFIEDGEKGGGK